MTYSWQKLEDAVLAMDGDDDRYNEKAKRVWECMSPGQKEQLTQLLFQGPVWDGNIISKADRSSLLFLGLATRCCFIGEQGYTAATYKAHTVFKQGGGTPIRTKLGCPG